MNSSINNILKITTLSSQQRENMLIVILTLLYLLPIWTFEYFPSQDGPTHLYNATLIHEFFYPTHDVFKTYYELNTNPDPTWFSHIILSVLTSVFNSSLAEKVFLTFYVVMFIFSVSYAIGVINSGSRWLVLLAFPLIYNYILYMGFYACSFSYAMSFFVLGYWMRYWDNWKIKNLIIFAFLILLLYLFHIVSFAMTLGVIGVFTIFSTYNDIYKQKFNYQIKDLIKQRIFFPFLSLIPTLIIVAIFLHSKDSAFYQGPSIWDRIKDIFYFDFIVTFQLLEESKLALFYVLVIIVPVITFIILKAKQRNIEMNDGLILASFACLIVYFTVPQMGLVSLNGMVGGAFITKRICAFPFFMAILWLAAQNFPVLLKRLVITSSLVLSVFMLTLNLYKTAEINVQIKEYLSGMQYIEPYTTVLPLNMDKNGYADNGLSLTKKTDPFHHIASHIGTLRRTIMLTNYEANIGYFPLLYNEKVNPYIHIGNVEIPGIRPVNFVDYETITGERIDYILIWLGKKRNLNGEFSKSIYHQLENIYELIYISENELMELYQIKQ